jgi:hypothetical protein
MTDPKKTLFANYKFIVLDMSCKNFYFFKDKDDVKRWHEDGSLGNGDIIIELTEATVKVAVQKHFLEIK